MSSGSSVPATDAEALGEWFAEQSNSGSLVEYLKTFDLTTAVMQTRDGLSRVAREFVQDLAADGVIYGEIRWAPEQHLTRGLTLDEAVEAVQAGIEQGLDDVQSAGRRIRVGQLVTAMRHNDRGARDRRARRAPPRARASSASTSPAPRRVPAALGIAPRSTTSPASSCPSPIHAGEADGLESIRGALLDGRALRLGHGVRIAEDLGHRAPRRREHLRLARPIAQWVRDREIALETSPSSNVQTGAIAAWGDELVDHPFDLLYQLGFRVTVNTDNRLQSGTSLTRELALLSDAFGYDLDDLETFQLNAAASAFLPLDDREELAELIQDGFDEA